MSAGTMHRKKRNTIICPCLPFAEYVAGRYNCYGPLPEHLRSPLAYLKKLLEAGIDFDVIGIQLYSPAEIWSLSA